MSNKFNSQVSSIDEIREFTNELYWRDKKSVRLADGYFQFIIPEYQRQYAWSIENIDNFITSIKEIVEETKRSEKDTFFGQIIFSKNADYNLELVDGQQRVTTFTIMARLIFEEAANQMSEKIKGMVKDFIYSNPEQKEIRLQVQSVNKVVFETYVFLNFEKDSDIVSKAKINLIDGFDTIEPFDHFLIENRVEVRKKLAAHFKSSTGYKKDNYERIVANLNQIFDDLIRDKSIFELEMVASTLQYIQNNMLIADDSDDALEIFQTLNSMGKPLTDYDLIKSETISKLGVVKEWLEIDKLPNMTNTDVSDAINLFLKITYSNNVKWDKKTYKEFKKKFSVLDSDIDRTELVEKMFDFVRLYSDIKNGNGFNGRVDEKLNEISKSKQINDHFAMLMKLKYKPCLTIPFKLAVDLIDDGSEKIIKELYDAIIFACYAPLIKVSIFGEKPSELESIAKEWINDNKVNYKKKFVDGITRKDFVEQCENTTKLVDEKAKIVLSLFEPKLAVDLTKIKQVEHIFPKKAIQKEWKEFFEKDADSYVNRIGNLVLLSDIKNKEAGNSSFETKKKIYNKESNNYIQIQKIREFDSWKPENVDERSKELALAMKNKFISYGLLND